VADFMNLKIKLIQSFENTHRGRVCVCAYIGEYLYTYEYLRVYYVSKKIVKHLQFQKLVEQANYIELVEFDFIFMKYYSLCPPNV
jgi:hypothetical protein